MSLLIKIGEIINGGSYDVADIRRARTTLPPSRFAFPRSSKRSAALALLALLSLWVAPILPASTVSDYSGVAYSPFGVSYSDGTPPGYTNAIKGFGNYNLGDIQGDLAFIDGLGISRLKTYNSGIFAPTTFTDLSAYVSYFSNLNTGVATNNSSMVVTALQNLNNPFIEGASVAGTKWVTSEVAARGMKILQGANASGALYTSAPTSQSALTVTLLQSSGTATRNVSITPQSYQYTDFSGSSQTITYSNAHWDIELALMNIANGKMSVQQPAAGPTGAYGATALGGTNSEATLGLIIGNEVNANGLSAAQVAQLMAFAKARRADYGITAAQLPITTNTNAAGVWQPASGLQFDTLVLPYVDGIATYNTYGFPFDSSGEAEGGPTVTPQNGIAAVVQTQTEFQQWLNENGHADVQAFIGEQGWPTTSLDNTDNSFSLTNAENYYHGVDGQYEGAPMQLAAIGAVNFLFELYDEPWKNTANPGSSEDHFGIATVTQTTLRPDGVNDPSQDPEVRALKFSTQGDFQSLYESQVVPEPSALSLIALGLLAAGAARRRRR